MGGICAKNKKEEKRLYVQETIRPRAQIIQEGTAPLDLQVVSLSKVYNMIAFDNNATLLK